MASGGTPTGAKGKGPQAKLERDDGDARPLTVRYRLPEDGPAADNSPIPSVLASPRPLKTAGARGSEARRRLLPPKLDGREDGGQPELPREAVDANPLPAVYVSEIKLSGAQRIALYCDQILQSCKVLMDIGFPESSS